MRQLPESAGSRRTVRRVLGHPVAWVGPGAALAAVAAVGVLGILHELNRRHLGRFALDAERRLPAKFSALLLIAAAGAGLLAALVRARHVHPLACLTFSLALAYMAVDEYEALHEALEHRFGVDWQLLYLPLLGVVALAWLGTVRGLRDVPHARALLMGGAALWVAAQVLERFEWTHGGAVPVRWYTPMMVTEEITEMLGTLAFATAFFVAVRSSLPRGAAVVDPTDPAGNPAAALLGPSRSE